MQQDSQWQEREAARLILAAKTAPRATLLRDLLRGNGDSYRQEDSEPVPKGFRYVDYMPRAAKPLAPHGETVAYHAHQSDISADFGPFLIEAIRAQGGTFHQVLLTRGENGSGLPKAQAIAKRMAEEQQSASLYGIDVEYLRSSGNDYFTDGALMRHLPELTWSIKQEIRRKKPGRIILPSPWPDHPDHLAINIAVTNAVIQLESEGYFKTHGKIEMLACEPEFGSALGHWKRDKDIPEEYGGSQTEAMRRQAGLKLDPAIKHYPYVYDLDTFSGLVHPAPDLKAAQPEALSRLSRHAFSVPPFIYKVSDAMQERRMAALVRHESQMQNTRYGDLLPGLDRVRGEAAGSAWGVGLYPVHIDGATVAGTPFIDALPGGSVVQLKKERNIERHPWEAKPHARVRPDAGLMQGGMGI